MFILFQAGRPAVLDAVEAGITDLYLNKYWAIKFATVAACTVLKVDQVSLKVIAVNHTNMTSVL